MKCDVTIYPSPPNNIFFGISAAAKLAARNNVSSAQGTPKYRATNKENTEWRKK